VSVSKNQIAQLGYDVGMLIGSAMRHVRMASGCCAMALGKIEKVYPELDPASLAAQNLDTLATILKQLSAQLEAASTCVENIGPETSARATAPEVAAPPEPLMFVAPVVAPEEGGA
jgi:hypothetical protein